MKSTKDLVGDWNLELSNEMVETNVMGTLRVVATFCLTWCSSGRLQ